MALRPEHVSKLRFALSTPFILANIILAVILVIAPAEGMKHLQRGVKWCGQQASQHILRPIVMAIRLIQGTPTWLPTDLNLGWQPMTRHQEQLAKRADDVVMIHCTCKRRGCMNGRFVLRPFQLQAIDLRSFAKAEAERLAAQKKANHDDNKAA